MEAAFAEAQPGQPRNLYLVGIFVADHQLPEPTPSVLQALPAPSEPAGAIEIEALQLPSQPTMSAQPTQPVPVSKPQESVIPPAPTSSAEVAVSAPIAAPAVCFLPPPDQPALAAPSLAVAEEQASAPPPPDRAKARQTSASPPVVPSQDAASAAPTSAGAGGAEPATLRPRSDLETMQYLVDLLAQPPGYIDMEDPRLHGLGYTGLPPKEADRRWKQDMASLLLCDTIGPRNVIVLHPQVLR